MAERVERARGGPYGGARGGVAASGTAAGGRGGGDEGRVHFPGGKDAQGGSKPAARATISSL